MPSLSFAPALSLFTAFARHAPAQPLQAFIRTTGYRLRPPRPVLFRPAVSTRQEALLVSGAVGVHQAANILYEERKGSAPTIVLGGFVPDATEQVFLMRGYLLKHGSVYYVNYPRRGFSADLLFAQLDDLVEELARRHGQRPVVFAVSFGAGLVMEWLRRARLAGRQTDLQGLVLISPVGCVEDLLGPGEAKPATLLGRAIKPLLQGGGTADRQPVEKARMIFAKMFESGAQNREALRLLMTPEELRALREAVMGTIAAVDANGALERVRALRQMEPPSSYFSQALLPLSRAPTLVLYSEKESAVLAEHSPSRFVLEAARPAYFPNSRFQVISNGRGSPVQHASLVFHCFNFLPAISAFYRGLKSGRLRLSA